MRSSPGEEEACLEDNEVRVFLRPNGTALRKLKRRSAAAAMTDAQYLLDVSRHPNVVRILAIDNGNGDICMEAMTVSLKKHMPAGLPGPFPTKLHITRSVAQDLRHLHVHGMDHGDLCPANILLTWPASTPAVFRACAHGEMQVKLCDYYSAHTGTSRTAAYVEPEVVRSAPGIMCAADVWAFACCLLFLEGVQPFHGFEEDTVIFFYLGVTTVSSSEKKPPSSRSS
jgi:serine/threonine protein kinase